MNFNKYANELDELNEAAMQNDNNESNELDAEFKVYAIHCMVSENWTMICRLIFLD